MRTIVMVALFFIGCGGSDDSGPTPPVTSEQDSAVADVEQHDSGIVETGSPEYPSGPYGTEVGSVVADLELMGYLRDAATGLATEATYGAAKLSDVRARATVKYAVIHVSGFT